MKAVRHSFHLVVAAVTVLFCLPVQTDIFLNNNNSTSGNDTVMFWTPSMKGDNKTFTIPPLISETYRNQSDNNTASYHNGSLFLESNENGQNNHYTDNTTITPPINGSNSNDGITTDAKVNILDPDGEIHDRCSAKLYSCRNRCNTFPRLACSCHVTCKVYGNCCEDFDDVCPSLLVRQEAEFGAFLQASVECVGNNFLIASCPSGVDLDLMTTNVSLDNEQWSPGLDAEDMVARCHQTESDNPQNHAPVTDTKTRLHFKNVFCAVCNGVLDLQSWHGLTHCKYGNLTHDRNRNQSLIIPNQGQDTEIKRKVLQNFDVQGVLSSDKCQTFWRPKNNTGEPINPCLHASDTKSSSQESNGLALRSHNTIQEMDTTVLEEMLSEKYSSLHLAWRNVSGGYQGQYNQSYFQEKCQTLNSFVEHPDDPSSRYKNKYCFMLDSQSAVTNKFCEPSLAISDDDGVWYTLELDRGTNNTGVTAPGDRWVVYEGIEEMFWDGLVSDTSLSRCDGKTALIYEGACRSKSFYLTMKTNFTFIRSSLIRGDFNDQVDKFTDLLVETFVDKLSNKTACVVVSFEHSKVSGSSVKYQSSAEFQCLDISPVETHSEVADDPMTSATPANLMHGGSIRDDDVNHYISFVTNTLRIVVEKEKAVTLPVTIELAPCIFPDKDADDKVRGYCTKVKNVWRAARKVNTIVGGLSLEGILTIICCILSVFGLVIRLALQNVVPFYKSYPGKIQFGLCLSLFLAYALFMLGGLVKEGSQTCTVLAIFTHVAFLSALFWMNVTAFEIWRTFRTWRNQVVSRGHASLILSVFYAVGIPLLIMMTALLVEEFLPHSQFSPSYGEHDCWLNGSMAVAFYFVTPCCIICCVNAIFVGLTLKSLRRQRTSISEFKKSNATTAVTDVGIVIKIILLVGITWLLGLLAALVDNEWLWILFTVINASLGFLISVVLVFNKRVYYTVKAKCLCYTNETISVVSTQVQRH